MIFQYVNHKKHMLIHNLQAKFRLIVTIIHIRDFKNILICTQMSRFADIFMRVCVCTEKTILPIPFTLNGI